jgi:hypothetical protein
VIPAPIQMAMQEALGDLVQKEQRDQGMMVTAMANTPNGSAHPVKAKIPRTLPIARRKTTQIASCNVNFLVEAPVEECRCLVLAIKLL